MPLSYSLFVGYRFYIVYRQSPLGPADPSFRALSGRLKFTFRRHKFNEDYLFRGCCEGLSSYTSILGGM